MKRNNFTKVLISIALVLIILGSICIGVGFIKGGELKYMSLNKYTISWWPFDNDIDEDEFNNQSIQTSKNLQLQNDMNNLIITADVGDIEVIRGSSNKIVLNKMNQKNINVEEKDGITNISVKHDTYFNNSNQEKIIVQLRDKEYKDIQIKSDLGKIKVDDIRSEKFQIHAQLGEIEMERIYSKDLYVNQSSGDVNVEGVLLGNSVIKNSLGKIDVEVRGEQNDYRYDVKTSLGKTKIQKETFKGSSSISQGDKNANNYLKIDCSMGDVKLSFH